MPVDTHDSTFRDALSQLQGGAHSLRWSYRRELALALGEVFAGGIATDAALALVHQLAGDPKWEVRHAVAELLANLPPDDFEQLVGRLAGDANHYVRRAAEQALQRQRSDRRAIGCKRRSADQLNQHLQIIEAEHGKAAANRALRLCERYSELLVGLPISPLRKPVQAAKTYIMARSGPEMPSMDGADLVAVTSRLNSSGCRTRRRWRRFSPAIQVLRIISGLSSGPTTPSPRASVHFRAPSITRTST